MKIIESGKHWALGQWKCPECNCIFEVGPSDVGALTKHQGSLHMARVTCPCCGQVVVAARSYRRIFGPGDRP